MLAVLTMLAALTATPWRWAGGRATTGTLVVTLALSLTLAVTPTLNPNPNPNPKAEANQVSWRPSEDPKLAQATTRHAVYFRPAEPIVHGAAAAGGAAGGASGGAAGGAMGGVSAEPEQGEMTSQEEGKVEERKEERKAEKKASKKETGIYAPAEVEGARRAGAATAGSSFVISHLAPETEYEISLAAERDGAWVQGVG